MTNKTFGLYFVCSLMMAFLSLGDTVAKSAMGEQLCLTCHQYPGLVRQNDKAGLKILHIDKVKYRASVHGELDCTACHTDIDKIPHVGQNKTNCQNQCHQSEQDKRLLAKTARKGFHKQEQSVITRLEDKTSCKVCHQIYPHTKAPFVRSFLNMHTSYLVCEVCHLDRAKYTVEIYGWVQDKGVYFQGEAFGSYYDPLRKLTKTPDTTLSRIAPYAKREGKMQALINTWDTDGAMKVYHSRSRLSEEEIILEMKHFHRDVVKMKQTTACEECHSAKGIIDFRAIGFSKERSLELKKINIGNIIKRYDVFYMPDL